MTIFIGTDHAGFELKEKLIDYLEDLGYEVIDKGAYELDPKDDYPDFMAEVAAAVSDNPEEDKGIVIGGSGQGEAMVCNRFPGIRATVYYATPSEALAKEGLDIIKLSREHNNANVLSLGARFITEEEAKEAVKLWLETPFPGEKRHIRRIKKIDKINY